MSRDLKVRVKSRFQVSKNLMFCKLLIVRNLSRCPKCFFIVSITVVFTMLIITDAKKLRTFILFKDFISRVVIYKNIKYIYIFE